MEGQTRVKTLPSRRTTYAGGKNNLFHFKVSSTAATDETEISPEQVCDGTDDCERGEGESLRACAEKNGQ